MLVLKRRTFSAPRISLVVVVAVVVALATACGSEDPSGATMPGLDGGTDASREPTNDGGGIESSSEPAVDAAADAADAADAGPLPPLTGLKLWLDAEVGVVAPGGGNLTSWSDRTGTTPTKLTILTNGVSAVQPTALAGHPGVLLNDVFVEATLASALQLRPFSTFVVGRYVSATSFGNFLRLSLLGGGNVGLVKETSDLFRLRSVHPIDFYIDTVPNMSAKTRLVGLRRKGAFFEVRVDGAVYSGTDTGGPASVQASFRVEGSASDPGPTFPGLIPRGIIFGDVLLYDADLSDGEVATVEAFLIKKYAL